MGNQLLLCSGCSLEKSYISERQLREDHNGTSWSISSCTEPLLSKRNLLMLMRLRRSMSKKKRTKLSSTRMPTPLVKKPKAPMKEKKAVKKVEMVKVKITE